MKRFPTLAITAVLCLLVFSACAPKVTPTPTPTIEAPLPAGDLEATARAFTALLMEGKYADAYAMFEPQMAAAMSADKLKATWEEVVRNVGALNGIKEVRLADEAGYRIAYVACDFARTPLDMRIVFDDQGRITGLWFVPAGSGDT
jgi:hypothetical protein